MAKRKSKPVQVWPLAPIGPYIAMRWERKGDWVALCKMAGWAVGNTSDDVDCLIDSEGDEFGQGDWLVVLPSGKKAFTDAEFRSRFTVEKVNGKA